MAHINRTLIIVKKKKKEEENNQNKRKKRTYKYSLSTYGVQGYNYCNYNI